MNTLNKRQGIIKTIFLIIVAVIVLSYLGFDLKKIMTSDLVQKNFTYLSETAKAVWSSYLATPFRFVWNEMLKPLWDILWKLFKAGIEEIKGANNK